MNTNQKIVDVKDKAKLVEGDMVYCKQVNKVGVIIENQPKYTRARIKTYGETNQVFIEFYHYDNFYLTIPEE